MTTPIPDERLIERHKKLLEELKENKTRDERHVVADRWQELIPPRPPEPIERHASVDKWLPPPPPSKLNEPIERHASVDKWLPPPPPPKLKLDERHVVTDRWREWLTPPPPLPPIDEKLSRRVPRVPWPPELHRWLPELLPQIERLLERTRRKRVQPIPA